MKFIAIFDIKLNISKLIVAIHPRTEVIGRFDDIKYVEIYRDFENGSYSIQSIFYKRMISYSLPKPYETDCFDYKTQNYTSRRNCIDG